LTGPGVANGGDAVRAFRWCTGNHRAVAGTSRWSSSQSAHIEIPRKAAECGGVNRRGYFDKI
jgi:hypothetical protein